MKKLYRQYIEPEELPEVFLWGRHIVINGRSAVDKIRLAIAYTDDDIIYLYSLFDFLDLPKEQAQDIYSCILYQPSD